MNYTINDLLDFSPPNVVYEDQESKDVCGCCGTYFVVHAGELEEAKTIVSEMHEALKKAESALAIVESYRQPDQNKIINVHGIVRQALAKAEGRENAD